MTSQCITQQPVCPRIYNVRRQVWFSYSWYVRSTRTIPESNGQHPYFECFDHDNACIDKIVHHYVALANWNPRTHRFSWLLQVQDGTVSIVELAEVYGKAAPMGHMDVSCTTNPWHHSTWWRGTQKQGWNRENLLNASKMIIWCTQMIIDMLIFSYGHKHMLEYQGATAGVSFISCRVHPGKFPGFRILLSPEHPATRFVLFSKAWYTSLVHHVYVLYPYCQTVNRLHWLHQWKPGCDGRVLPFLVPVECYCIGMFIMHLCFASDFLCLYFKPWIAYRNDHPACSWLFIKNVSTLSYPSGFVHKQSTPSWTPAADWFPLNGHNLGATPIYGPPSFKARRDVALPPGVNPGIQGYRGLRHHGWRRSALAWVNICETPPGHSKLRGVVI